MNDNTKRMTCRDQNGGFRLVPGANVIDALDKLGEYEEREYGHLVIKTSTYRLGDGYKCKDCNNYRGPCIGSGICEAHPARDKHKNVVVPHRLVQASRLACADKFEPKENIRNQEGVAAVG